MLLTYSLLKFDVLLKLATCSFSKFQEPVFKCLSRFVSGWKGICDGIQDVQDMKDSLSQTYGYWFERFMLGCHKQTMGDMVAVPDYSLSVEIFQDIFGEIIFGIYVKCGRTQYH